MKTKFDPAMRCLESSGLPCGRDADALMKVDDRALMMITVQSTALRQYSIAADEEQDECIHPIGRHFDLLPFEDATVMRT